MPGGGGGGIYKDNLNQALVFLTVQHATPNVLLHGYVSQAPLLVSRAAQSCRPRLAERQWIQVDPPPR